MSKILLVDDDAIILRTVSRLLKGTQVEIETASNGEEALNCLEKDTYTAVICDMDMPKVTGAQVLEALQSRFPHMVGKFAFHTSNMDQALFLHPIALGKCNRDDLVAFIDNAKEKT